MNSIEHLANLKIIETYIGFGIAIISAIVVIIGYIITIYFGDRKRK